METPATGLYGPGDYGPEFVTIDELAEHAMARANDAVAHGKPSNPPSVRWMVAEHGMRCQVVTALIELAHDLDARGLVLIDLDGLKGMQKAAWDSGYNFGRAIGEIDTADADAETGGE